VLIAVCIFFVGLQDVSARIEMIKIKKMRVIFLLLTGMAKSTGVSFSFI